MHLELSASPFYFALAANSKVTVNYEANRRDAYERSHAAMALLSEIGRVETRNLTRRGSTRPDAATSRRTMRRCPWRLGYGSTPPLLPGPSRGRKSLREFDAVRCDGPRCDQALVNLPEGHLHRSQDASSRLLRSFIGVFAVHTFDPRQRSHQNRARRLRRCRSTQT